MLSDGTKACFTEGIYVLISIRCMNILSVRGRATTINRLNLQAQMFDRKLNYEVLDWEVVMS